MAENPITAQGIFTQLYTSFPSVQTTAVSHVESNGGDHFFMVLVRADAADSDGGLGKHGAGGDSKGSQPVPKRQKKRGALGAALDNVDELTERLGSVMNRHLVDLLQQPLDWVVFGEKDKHSAGGHTPGHRHGGAGAPSTPMDAPAEDILLPVDAQDNNPRTGGPDLQQAADAVDAIFQVLNDLEP